jgi:hypothetical protein
MTTKTDNLPAVPSSNNGVAIPTEDPWAELREAFDDGSKRFAEHMGLSLPRLRSDFGRNGRGWIDDLTGTVTDTLSVVLLAYPPTRAWWEKSLDEGGSGPPDCKSWDMVRPDPASPMAQSITCATCPHSKWGDNNERPGCAQSINVIAYDTGDKQFVWLRFAGTGIDPFRRYISALASRRLPAYAVVTHITLDDEKRDKFEWKKPHFAIGDPLTPADVAPMRDVAKQAMEMWQTVAEDMAGAERSDTIPTTATEAGGSAAGTYTTGEFGDGEEPF